MIIYDNVVPSFTQSFTSVFSCRSSSTEPTSPTMTADTTFSETNHRIQQVMLSLQRLSQRVLPDMKRATDDMRSGDSPFAAASHEALLLETHRVIGAALKELGSIAKSHR